MHIKTYLLPLVMGLGFEFIKFAGCHDNLFVKIVSAPGLWMQRITTNEPTDDIIEVGIAALKAALYGVEEKTTETVREEQEVEDEVVELSKETAEEVEKNPVDETANELVEEIVEEENNYASAQSIVDDLFAEILADKKNND